MIFSNMTHFLDEEGNIAKEMHKEGRELASFLALVVDATTKIHREPNDLPPIILGCYVNGRITSSVPTSNGTFPAKNDLPTGIAD